MVREGILGGVVALSFAEGTTIDSGAIDLTALLRWSVTQGGLAIVLLVVAWAYRRDVLAREAAVRAENETLITLVQDVTEALGKNTAASDANRLAIDRMAGAFNRLADRRHQ